MANSMCKFSPKSHPYIFLGAALLLEHPTAAFYACVQTDCYINWAQMEKNGRPCSILHITAAPQIGCDTPSCTAPT